MADEQSAEALRAQIAKLRAELAEAEGSEPEPDLVDDEMTFELVPPRLAYTTRVKGQDSLKRYDLGKIYGEPAPVVRLLLKKKLQGQPVFRLAAVPQVDPKEGLRNRGMEVLEHIAARGDGFLDKLERALAIVDKMEETEQPDGEPAAADGADAADAADPKDGKPRVGAEPETVKTGRRRKKKAPAKAKPKKAKGKK